MTLLEALLLFVSLAWLVADAAGVNHHRVVGHDREARRLDVHGQGVVGHGQGALDHLQRAEQRLQQLTDEAVLAMVAELRRQLGNDW